MKVSAWPGESLSSDKEDGGARPKKCGGRKLSHDLRLELFNEVIKLREQGYSYEKIMRAISQKYGVTLSKSHISYWTRGIHTPINEPYNKPDLTPSPELATVAAAVIGDGALKETEDGAVFEIKMKDIEPIQLIAQCMAKIIGKPEPYFIGRLSDGRYYTQIMSRELCSYLYSRENILQLLHQYPKEFIRMFFECEGGPYGSIIHKKRFRFIIGAFNTDLQLLQVISEELTGLGISSGISLKHKAGAIFASKSRGKVIARKDCYAIEIRQIDSIKKYATNIGFVSERKQIKLRDIVEIYEIYGSGVEAVIEWLRRYKYVRGGRERWMRRINYF